VFKSQSLAQLTHTQFWFVAYIVAFVLSLVRRRHYRAETGSPASEIEEKGLTAEAARSAVSPLA